MLNRSTKDQQYCTGCAIAVLLGFLALALYADPRGLGSLNPFESLDCARAPQQSSTDKKQSAGDTSTGLEGGKSSIKQPTTNQGTRDINEQGGTTLNDRYACQLAVYTRKLALFTLLLVGATEGRWC